jgi:cytochrome c biogenesis protein CcmG, thiol:disulfide interchange protein DsbE
MVSRMRFVPLLVFALLVAAVAWRLVTPKDDRITSKLEGRRLPPFVLAAAVPTKPGLSSTDLAIGRPHLLNIFASWCVPCAAEAPILLDLKRRGVVINAIAIRDTGADVAAFLERNGDPFDRIGSDPASQAQIALGSSGVPETFVIDGKGVVRAQHIGPILREDVAMILAALERAR